MHEGEAVFKELLHFNLFIEVPNKNIDLSIQNVSNGDKVEVDSAKTEINWLKSWTHGQNHW